MTILCMILLSGISLALILINYVVGKKDMVNREKSSIFECGFDPSAASRMPFSMHFFLVALIFLIFDVEISILLPLPCAWNSIENQMIVWLALTALALLIGGALVEWVEGSLEWNI